MKPEARGGRYSSARTTLLAVTYQHGIVRRIQDAKGAPSVHLSGSGIPASVRDAIARERARELGGVYGDPSWGEPIQYDRLVIETDRGTTQIEVFNRAIQLFVLDDERIRSIHRLCETVRNAVRRPG